MVEVFKTNVDTERDARMLSGLITRYYPGYRISFDLDDCDKVLRIEGEYVDHLVVIGIVSRYDYRCCMLE